MKKLTRLTISGIVLQMLVFAVRLAVCRVPLSRLRIDALRTQPWLQGTRPRGKTQNNDDMKSYADGTCCLKGVSRCDTRRIRYYILGITFSLVLLQ